MRRGFVVLLILGAFFLPFCFEHEAARGYSDNLILTDFQGVIEYTTLESEAVKVLSAPAPAAYSLGSDDPIKTFTFYPAWGKNYEVSINNGAYTPIGYGDSYTLITTKIRTALIRPAIITKTVNFYGFSGELLDTESVVLGGAVAYREPPEVDGYSFSGWKENGKEEFYDFSSPVTANLSLYAIYESLTTYYTLSFFDENNNLIGSLEVAENGFVTAPAPPEKYGYTFVCWTEEDGTPFDLLAPVTKDYILYPEYTRIYHAVNFFADGTLFLTVSIAEGETVTEPSPPDKEGYDFLGWFENGKEAPFDFSQVIEKGFDLYAAYERKSYTVTFILNNGQPDYTVSVYHGEDAVPPGAPEKTDYVFSGWEGCYTGITAPAVVYAVYTLKYVYARFIFYDGGEETVRTEIGSAVSPPALPVRTGYDALGWLFDSAIFDFQTLVFENMTFYAGYQIKVFEIIFDLNGGASADDTPLVQHIAYGGNAVLPASPKKTGYTFTGWDASNLCITEDRIITALYEKNRYTVTFYDIDGLIYHKVVIPYGEPVPRPSSAPEPPAGFLFTDWYRDDEEQPFIFGNGATENLNIYARYERIKLSVSLMDGENTLSAAEIFYGEKLVSPAPPQKTGMAFDGWYTDSAFSEIYDFCAPVTEDLTIYAKYSYIEYSIYTDISEGIVFGISAETARYGQKVTYIYQPPAGYKIVVHTLTDSQGNDLTAENGAFIMPPSAVTLTLTLSAERYTLTVIAEGNAEIIVPYGGCPELTPPVREDEIFTGWYLDESFCLPFDGSVEGEDGEIIRLYPRFAEEFYDITLNIPDFTYDIGGELFTFTAEAQPLKAAYLAEIKSDEISPPGIEGHDFLGWYKDAEYTEPFISKEVTGEFILYAKYAVKRFTVTFIYGENLSKIRETTLDYYQLPQPPGCLDYCYGRFIKWSEEPGHAVSDAVYTAEYKELYDNFYMDGDTLIVETRDEMSADPSAAFTAPGKTGYTFIGFVWERTEGRKAYYRARYEAKVYPVSLIGDGGGVLTLSGTPSYGNTLTLTAVLNEGYSLLSVTADGGVTLDGGNPVYTFTMPDKGITITLKTAKTPSPAETAVTVNNTTNLLLGDAGEVCRGLSRAALTVCAAETGDAEKSGVNLAESEYIISACSYTVCLKRAGETAEFAAEASLKILVPLAGYGNSERFIVLSKSGCCMSVYDYYIEDGYIVFYADKAGKYTILGVNSKPDNLSGREILFLSLLSAMGLFTVVSLISIAKKKKRIRY